MKFNYVDFEINPEMNYDIHELNILKESIIFWNENPRFFPKFKEFEFKETIVDGKSIFECIASHHWLKMMKLSQFFVFN